MLVQTLWFLEDSENAVPELLCAWDAYSIDENPTGFEEDMNRAHGSRGDAGEYRRIELSVNEDDIMESFRAQTVEATATGNTFDPSNPKTKTVKTGHCRFNMAWVGHCNQPCVGDICEKHAKKKCRCGKQATRECSHAGQFVCGAPLCDDCKCGIQGHY